MNKNGKERKNKSKTGVYLVYFGENESNMGSKSGNTKSTATTAIITYLLQLYYVNSKQSFQSQRILALEVQSKHQMESLDLNEQK